MQAYLGDFVGRDGLGTIAAHHGGELLRHDLRQLGQLALPELVLGVGGVAPEVGQDTTGEVDFSGGGGRAPVSVPGSAVAPAVLPSLFEVGAVAQVDAPPGLHLGAEESPVEIDHFVVPDAVENARVRGVGEFQLQPSPGRREEGDVVAPIVDSNVLLLKTLKGDAISLGHICPRQDFVEPVVQLLELF